MKRIVGALAVAVALVSSSCGVGSLEVDEGDTLTLQDDSALAIQIEPPTQWQIRRNSLTCTSPTQYEEICVTADYPRPAGGCDNPDGGMRLASTVAVRAYPVGSTSFYLHTFSVQCGRSADSCRRYAQNIGEVRAKARIGNQTGTTNHDVDLSINDATCSATPPGFSFNGP